LVFGSSLLAGGMKYKIQHCDKMAVSVYGNMALLASILLILPALFANSLPLTLPGRNNFVNVVSLGTATILIIAYIAQLFFQLHTHKAWFVSQGDDKDGEKPSEAKTETELVRPSGADSAVPVDPLKTSQDGTDSMRKLSKQRSVLERPRVSIPPEEGEEEMTVKRAIIQLSVATVFVALMSEVIVDSVTITAQKIGLSQVFTGIVIIAIVGNAAEHTTSIMAAYKDKLDISVAIAFGSSLQIALFVFPLLVLISCARAGNPMNMVFTNMECVAIFFAVLTVWVICSDSETTWLEGGMLLALYIVFALIFFYVPDDSTINALYNISSTT